MASSVIPPEAEAFLPNGLLSISAKGKSVLITGGASGIGLACAKAIASHGAFVTIADLQQEAGEAAVKDMSSNGGKAQFIECNVTPYDSQVAVFKSAIQFRGGSIDIVIPCVGIISEKNLVDMAAKGEPTIDAAPPEPRFNGVEVNLKCVYYTTYLALHYFRLPPPAYVTPFKKAIVLMASMAGYIGYPFSTTYSMSKFGVRGILYGIRERALEQQVRVNLVAPWYIETPMTTKGAPDAHVSMFGFAPMESVVDAVLRFSTDEDVAARSAVIMPHGSFPLGDNIWEGFGGPVMQEKLGAFGAQMAKKAT